MSSLTGSSSGARHLDLRAKLDASEATAAIVDAALADVPAPAGWTVRQVPGHLDATWRGPDGRWGRLTLRLVRGSVAVTFDCDRGDRETVAAAFELLELLRDALRRSGSC